MAYTAINIEEMLSTCLPGGTHCDPQVIADAIRQYATERPSREWTAEDVTEEQAVAVELYLGEDFEDWYLLSRQEVIAAVANIMGVPRPQPAVDVERLEALLALARESVLRAKLNISNVESYIGELSQPTAAESEWPADAPEWADRLVQCGDGRMWYHGCDTTTGDSTGYWTPINKQYTGTRPASWVGKPWQECVLRRP